MKIIITLVILLLVSVSPQGKTDVLPKGGTAKLDASIKGLTVKNAVIIKANNKFFYYRKKCKSCNFTSPKTIGSGLPEGLFTCKSKFICPKCKDISEVSIQRVPTKTDISINGVTVKNAVIIKANDKYFYYLRKCKSCNFTSPKTIGSGLPEGLFTCKSKFICPKCKDISEVLIQRKTAKTIN